MKKILGIILIITILFALSACNGNNGNNNKLKIVTTIFPYYSFASEIYDDAEITMLIKPGTESHTYDPTPQDILKIQNSDVFIYTGGESDKWVETILTSVDTNKTKIIKAIDSIDLIHSEYDEHNHAETTDEHIWTSVKNAEAITHKIYNTVNKNEYRENLNKYIEKLIELDMEFNKLAINSTKKTLIFADRFPFSYFINDYKFKYISAFPSCSEESEPSVQTMSEIIDTIKSEKISSVFYIEFSNQKIADTVQSETAVKKLLFHSCHNVTAEEFKSGATYLSLMQQNLENLKEAIN